MQITQNVYNMHIDDGSEFHPGGSNNFFVGDPSSDMILIDTGDYERLWTNSILDYYEELGKPKISSIVITHGHEDHTHGLDRIQEVTGAIVRCHPKLVKKLQKILDNEEIVIPLKSRQLIETESGISIRALFTPGHDIDHVCYYLKEDKVMFTGDTVLGASSTSVRNLAQYMKSLELLTKFKVETVCPGHGPVVPLPNGSKIIQRQLDHRINRENQVLNAIKNGYKDISAIALYIYPKNLQKNLRPAAERNVQTHIEKLLQDGKISETVATYDLS